MTPESQLESPFNTWPLAIPFTEGVGIVVFALYVRSRAYVITGALLIGFTCLLCIALVSTMVTCSGRQCDEIGLIFTMMLVFGTTGVLLIHARSRYPGFIAEVSPENLIIWVQNETGFTPKTYAMSLGIQVETRQEPNDTVTWYIGLWYGHQWQSFFSLLSALRANLIQTRLHGVITLMQRPHTEENWPTLRRLYFPGQSPSTPDEQQQAWDAWKHGYYAGKRMTHPVKFFIQWDQRAGGKTSA